MAKSKQKDKKAVDSSAVKVLKKAKGAGITKPSQTPKAKNKEIARQIVKKEEEALKKKKKKAPTPSSSDSGSESDKEMDSSSSSSSGSSSEDEMPPVKTKQNGPPKAKPKAKAKAVESESESSSEYESGSDSDSETESVKKAEIKKPAVKTANKKGNSSDSQSESESNDSESEKEAPVKAKKGGTNGLNGDKKTKGNDSESSESDAASESAVSSSDSESGEEEDVEDMEAPKKRKAEVETGASAKKPKTSADAEAANSPNLFVGNLSWNVDEEWLRRAFESFGELSDVRIMTDRETGRSRGFGYVEFSKPADAKAAYDAMRGTEMDGRNINVDYANPRPAGAEQGTTPNKSQARARSFGDQTSPESDTLFIANIAFGADQDSIRDMFQEKGSIMGIRLPTDPVSGRPKGFGYIQFSSVDEARQALTEFQGAELAGRPLRLDFSAPRSNDGGNRGGRGGRGGSRGSRGGGRGAQSGGFGGRGGRGNRGGFSDYSGRKTTFD